jgi:hypothetical protein
MRCRAPAICAIALLALSGPAMAGTFTVGSGASLDLGTGSLALGCADLDVMGTFSAGTVGFTEGRDVTITPSGVVNGDSGLLQLSGDWDNTGSFVAGTSTVRVVDGCSLLSGVVNGSTTFNNLELTTALGRQVSFTAGSTQTVTGAFTALGAANNLLKIRSTLDGSAAFMNVTGTSSTSDIFVRDNDATPGNDIPLGSNSIKGSNSPGWLLAQAIPLLPPLAGALLLASLAVLARRRLAAH